MRDRGVLNMRRAFPRMSWSPKNLYNLYRRTAGPRADDLRFRLTASTTLFQQRWKSKALVRAYHGDFIPEKIFKRWYLPETLPDVRPARVAAAPAGDDKALLDDYARRKNRETQFNEEIEEKGMAPVGSLMFAEVERRIDVFIFRCCFAHSVYEARRLVIHGDVYLNGKKHTNANTRLAPGDMVSVNPDAIRFFKNLPGEHDDIVARLLEPSKKSIKANPVETEVVEATESEPTSLEEAPASSSEEPSEETPSETSSSPAPRYTPFKLPYYASPHLFIPSYIEPSFSTCSAIYVRHPTARPGYSEVPTPYDADGALVRYAWEWYVQRRPRVRSQSQLARMPEDRALGATKEERDQRKKAIVEEGRKRRVVDTDRVRKVLKNSGRKVKAV